MLVVSGAKFKINYSSCCLQKQSSLSRNNFFSCFSQKTNFGFCSSLPTGQQEYFCVDILEGIMTVRNDKTEQILFFD